MAGTPDGGWWQRDGPGWLPQTAHLAWGCVWRLLVVTARSDSATVGSARGRHRSPSHQGSTTAIGLATRQPEGKLHRSVGPSAPGPAPRPAASDPALVVDRVIPRIAARQKPRLPRAGPLGHADSSSTSTRSQDPRLGLVSSPSMALPVGLLGGPFPRRTPRAPRLEMMPPSQLVVTSGTSQPNTR